MIGGVEDDKRGMERTNVGEAGEEAERGADRGEHGGCEETKCGEFVRRL